MKLQKLRARFAVFGHRSLLLRSSLKHYRYPTDTAIRSPKPYGIPFVGPIGAFCFFQHGLGSRGIGSCEKLKL